MPVVATEKLSLRIALVVEPDERGFHAYAPALKGLHVDGSTEAEVLQNAAEAVESYLASVSRHGDSLPIGQDLDQPSITLPPEARRYTVTVEWPSLRTSGIS